MSARRTRTVGAAGAVLLVGALTACSGGQPGAAAVVDGDRVIPVSDVDSATRELADALSGVEPSTILGVLIQEPVFASFAEQEGVGVSEDQVDDQIATLQEQAGGDTGAELSESARTVVRYTLEVAALQNLPDIDTVAPDVNAALGALDVTISPRYGTVASDGTIGTTSYDWIVPSADAATDAATTAP
ncbi:MAG TPA: hypothetical protein VGC57_10160 [Cellulomonas sp.]